jgi:glycosyltransferase involved in cell wall biosynthesis
VVIRRSISRRPVLSPRSRRQCSRSAVHHVCLLAIFPANGIRSCLAASIVKPYSAFRQRDGKRPDPVIVRVLVNAVPLAYGGGRTVGLNVLRALAVAQPKLNVLALIPAGSGYEEVCREAGIEAKVFGRPRAYPVWRIWFDQAVVPRIARQFSADVLFTLGNLGPVKPKLPHVILFHNPYYIYPAVDFKYLAWQERVSVGLQRSLFAWSVRSATYVIAQTQTAAERLRKRFKIGAGRVLAVPNTLSFAHFEAAPVDSPIAAKIAARRASTFTFLTLSRYYPHKNLEFVVEVARELAVRGDHRFSFFLTISKDQHPGAARLLRRIDELGLRSIVNLGPVPLDHLSAVYQSVDAVFFPTLLESHSGSFLEAMYYGLPILTSDRDFARESCGEAAVYFDAESVSEALSAIEIVFSNDALRRSLALAGSRQARDEGSRSPSLGRYSEVLRAAATGGHLPAAR